MNDLHPNKTATSLSRPRSRAPRLGLLVPATLLLLSGVVYAGVRILRHEGHAARGLCERVEVADAPGEPVLVQGWIPWLALRAMASGAVKEQVVFLHGASTDTYGSDMAAAELNHGELLVVATPDSSLLRRLRASRFRVSAAMEPATDMGPEFGGARIFFAAAPVGPAAGAVSSKP